ncbi:MAG TPA: NERD domain-containing protein [Metalysinibacillus jejuensis]|uniref:NERD domain-containing protein n=1 Tax=Metalysinibacillus jejuensis TaxID=914327 RepID=A0A921NBS6_9BACL|nr:NERD domain-containing protein [Metalysinibacillus jejuensis]HJH11139.1 NERD domain-containing protein [Metalysinibacillus jejuensis]
MAQLVKLQDYTSRYQIDLARYPTQFVRLKKNQWDRVKRQWEQGDEVDDWEHIEEEEEMKPRFSFMRKWFVKKEPEETEEVVGEQELLATEDEIPDEETTLTFNPKIVYAPQSLKELRQMFMNQFFHFQLKWASSTLREKSYVDPKFMRDSFLRTALLSLPDTYLVFYYPIIKIKKAPVELAIIIITPTECLCINKLEQEDQAVYVADGDRFWTKKVGKKDSKVLNPFISLNRTEAVLEQLFDSENITMPIRKVLLSRNGYFDYPGTAFNTRLIDKRNYQEWFEQIKRSASPMKHMQIKAAQTLLNQAQITSFNRNIWQNDEEATDDEA